jgi:hypothetical protein
MDELLEEFKKVFPGFEGSSDVVSSPMYLVKLLQKERENHQHLKRKYNLMVHDNWRLVEAFEKQRRVIGRLKKEKRYCCYLLYQYSYIGRWMMHLLTCGVCLVDWSIVLDHR